MRVRSAMILSLFVASGAVAETASSTKQPPLKSAVTRTSSEADRALLGGGGAKVDSPLVQAAKRSQAARAKKSSIVIDNHTVRMARGVLSESSYVPPPSTYEAPEEPARRDDSEDREAEVARQTAARNEAAAKVRKTEIDSMRRYLADEAYDETPAVGTHEEVERLLNELDQAEKLDAAGNPNPNQ